MLIARSLVDYSEVSTFYITTLENRPTHLFEEPLIKLLAIEYISDHEL